MQKIIIDILNYTILDQNNGDIILKKNAIINVSEIQDIKNYDFKKSSIIQCSINNKEFVKLKYNQIIKQIYELIGDGVKIIINTKLNIKTIQKENEGFYYLEKLGISVQGVDSNKCLLKIVNQCKKNKFSILLKIKLINNNIINIII